MSNGSETSFLSTWMNIPLYILSLWLQGFEWFLIIFSDLVFVSVLLCLRLYASIRIQINRTFFANSRPSSLTISQQKKNGACFVDDQAHFMQLTYIENEITQFIIRILKLSLLTFFKIIVYSKTRRKALQQNQFFSPIPNISNTTEFQENLTEKTSRNSNITPNAPDSSPSPCISTQFDLTGNNNLKCPLPDTARVCIIGSGASGLTYATSLIKLGHPPSLIDIYDENSSTNVGGQIRSFTLNNHLHEYGAIHVMSSYKTTLELLNEFQVNYAPLRHVKTVLNLSFLEKLQFIYSSLGCYMYFVAFGDFIIKTFPTLEDDPFPVLSKHPLLLLSVEQFLQTMHMDGLRPMLKIATFPMANVTTENVSLGLFLKFVPLSCLLRLVDNYIFGPLFTNHLFTGYYVPDGYNLLMKRMYNSLVEKGVNFYFDSFIHGINTIDPFHPIIQYNNIRKNPENIHNRGYDAVILAAAYSLREGERALPGAVFFDVIKQMKNVNTRKYMKFHVKIDIHNYPNLQVPLGDLFLAKPTMNGPYLYYNLHDELYKKDKKNLNDVLGIICEVDHWWMDRKLMETNIVHCIHRDLNIPKEAIQLFEDYNSITFHCISYAPSIEDLKNDYYGKLENIQGINNVYYANMLFTIDFSGSVMDYAKKLAIRMKHGNTNTTINPLIETLAMEKMNNNNMQNQIEEKTNIHAITHKSRSSLRTMRKKQNSMKSNQLIKYQEEQSETKL